MNNSRLLNAFYLLAALALAAPGIWLLGDPLGLLAELHPERGVDGLSPLLARQNGVGLLLAAAISLICIADPRRLWLHLAVTLFLVGLVLCHGRMVFSDAAWLWIAPALYALPLLKKVPKPPLPLPGSSQEAGNVKWFNPNKGFGFIATDDGREIFVHFKAVRNGGRRSLRTGTRVHFRTITTERGEQADEVYIEQDQ
jgi:CspA family cold shock protein